MVNLRNEENHISNVNILEYSDHTFSSSYYFLPDPQTAIPVAKALLEPPVAPRHPGESAARDLAGPLGACLAAESDDQAARGGEEGVGEGGRWERPAKTLDVDLALSREARAGARQACGRAVADVEALLHHVWAHADTPEALVVLAGDHR